MLPIMKRHRFWKLALLLAVPLVLLAITAERNSWRPKTIVSPDRQSTINGKVQFSPDGRYLNCARSNTNGYTRVFYDLPAGRLFDFTVLANSNYIAFVSNNRIACGNRVYSFPEGEPLFHSPRARRFIGALPDGKTLLTLQEPSEVETVTAWKVQTGQQSGRASQSLFPTPPVPAKNTWRRIYFLADKRTLAIADHKTDDNGEPVFEAPRDKRWGIKFWDIEKRKILFTIPVICYGPVVSFESGICAFSTPLQGNIVEVWNYKTGRQIGRIAYPFNVFISTYAPSPDGTLLAVSSSKNLHTIELWDIQSGKVIRTLDVRDTIKDLAFSPDGRTLASGSDDGSVKLWRIK